MQDRVLQPTWTDMSIAVTPSCVAWFALLVSQRNASLILIGGFLMTLVQDVYSSIYSPWYVSKNRQYFSF